MSQEKRRQSYVDDLTGIDDDLEDEDEEDAEEEEQRDD